VFDHKLKWISNPFKSLEDVMNETTFVPPVLVRHGFTLRHIESVRDAADFLDKWPNDSRNGIYEIALWACHAAINGRLSVGAARQGFEGWAKSMGILEDVSDALPWMSTQRNGRCGVVA
jgi:hypothetical protein